MPTKIILGYHGKWNRNRATIQKMDPYFDMYKAGSESRDFAGDVNVELLHQAKGPEGKPVLLDYKPDETAGAIRSIFLRSPLCFADMYTISVNVSEACLKGMLMECETHRAKLIVVTVKTDMTDEDCRTKYGCDAASAAERFIRWAKTCGAHGVVVPGPLLKRLPAPTRQLFDSDFISIVPGVRWEGQNQGGHVWSITPEELAEIGADYAVVDSAVWWSPKHPSLEALQAIHKIFNA